MENTYKMKTLGNKSYRCAFELTLEIIGGKWKLLIIYFLAGRGVLRFGELRRCLPEVSERMLVRQLRELEQDKIIHREVHHTVPPRVDYSLTEVGNTLIPIMNSLRDWGDEYDASVYQHIDKGLPLSEIDKPEHS